MAFGSSAMEEMVTGKMSPKKWIVLVTRNRLTAVTDNCAALKRFSQGTTEHYGLILQDNSDIKIPSSIVKYLEKYFHVTHEKSKNVLSMSENWNRGVHLAVQQGADFICVLSDRRLPTLNLDKAFRICYESCKDTYLVFDHQRTWINGETIMGPKYTGSVAYRDSSRIIQECMKCNFDGYTPRLFNCIVSKRFFNSLYEKFGTFVGGSAPDINFQARVAFMPRHQYGVYDSPCITTNARQVSHSNGTKLGNAVKSITKSEYFELSKPKSYPPAFEITTTGRCLGEVLQYCSPEFMSENLNQDCFLKSIFLEMSYPQSKEKHDTIKSIMTEYISKRFRNYNELVDVMNRIGWSPSHEQKHPINTSSSITNAPLLNYISKVEVKQ